MCFSLAWIEQILIWAVVVVAIDPYRAGAASIGLGRFHNRAGFKHRHVGGGRDLRDYHLLRFDLLPS
jgi:hypothetical protein